MPAGMIVPLGIPSDAPRPPAVCGARGAGCRGVVGVRLTGRIDGDLPHNFVARLAVP